MTRRERTWFNTQKRDWVLLGLGAAMCLSTVGEVTPTSPKNTSQADIIPPTIVRPNPTIGPANIAVRNVSKDRGVYH